MTAPRGKVAESLAARGRPENWANEQEAAVLSGYSPENFRQALRGLEAMGFPQVNRLNGKRFIPAILNFWTCQVDTSGVLAPKSEDEDGPSVENFHARQRKAS